MPLGVKPVCFTCKTTASTIWRKGADGEVLCNSCGVKQANGNSSSEGNPPDRVSGSSASERSSQNTGPVRKSARLKPSKYKQQPAVKLLPTKGKNRRVVFKKNPIKAPTAVSTVVTTEYIFHDGVYWQVGDVVSVMDIDGGIYYAQLRGFLQDQYSQKSAVITWLLPTTASPRDKFDPSTYILGPEEELPRSMDAFEFVCHAPTEYFKAQSAPYTTNPTKPELGFLWTSIGPEIRRVPTQEEIFGLRDPDCYEEEVLKKPEKRGRKAAKVPKKEIQETDLRLELKEEPT